MLLYLIFLAQTFAENEYDEQFARIEDQIKEIKNIIYENHVLLLYKDLNSLQELLSHINGEISTLEAAASRQIEGHSPLEVNEAEVTLKSTDKIVEKLALLDTKLINVDDREILDKIEEYVLKMDEIDNALRKIAKATKEDLEKFENHIKESHGHYWIYVMCLVTAVLVLLTLNFSRVNIKS